MFKRFITRASGVSTRTTVIAALGLLIAVAGVAWLLTQNKSQANASTAVQPYAARLDRVDGSVGIARADDRQADWAEATVNTPVTIGDRVYVRDGGHASIALTGHDYVQLNPATSLDLLSLEARRTQLALRSGSALFDVGELSSGELYEVATPCGAVDFQQPGLYQVGMDGNNAIISVLSGLAQVVGQEGTGTINRGQVFTLFGASSSQALASSLAPDLAGNIVDGYYRGRYPRVYDGRYRSYDAYLQDPSYYDPYRTSLSCSYVPADVPGIYDLDDYGDWVDVNSYGYCWAPRVSAGWAPFRSGYWDLDDVWGPSWVSSEAWGWAPYHYGRWAFVNDRWFWVPTEVRTRPAYCPAPVAFIPFADQIAWLPLGPSEVYVPRYYDVDFRPRYLVSTDVINVVNVQRTFVNFNAPGAVTVVPVRAFSRVVDPTVISTVDAGVVARSRAVLDPFSVEGIRQLAVNRDDARRRIRFARQEQAALSAPVIASVTPSASPVRADASALNVQAVSSTRKANKLQINDTGQVTSFRRADGLAQPLGQSQQQSQMAALAARAEQGDRSARREMRQLMREEVRTNQQQPQVSAQAQVEQSRQQMKEQRRLERQQQTSAAAQQQATRQAQQQQMRQQRRLERQQQSSSAAQQNQVRQQRRLERQQAAAQQQSAAAQQAQTRRVQRQQVRQQQQQQVLQQQQTRQQRKQERRPPEAFVQQQQRQIERSQRAQQAAAVQAQMAQQREQMKAQRHAERQTAMQQQQAAQRQMIQRQPQAPVVRQDSSRQAQRRAEKIQRRSGAQF